MTLDENGQLIVQVAQAAIDAAPAGWRLITVRIDAMGDSARYDSVARTGEGDEQFDIADSGLLATYDLRDSMYKKGSGTWYRATFVIDSENTLTTDFDYDAKPYRADQEGRDDIREVLMYDHELYPRANENLPDWHPAKQD